MVGAIRTESSRVSDVSRIRCSREVGSSSSLGSMTTRRVSVLVARISSSSEIVTSSSCGKLLAGSMMRPASQPSAEGPWGSVPNLNP